METCIATKRHYINRKRDESLNELIAVRAGVRVKTVDGWFHGNELQRPQNKVATMIEVCHEQQFNRKAEEILTPIEIANNKRPILDLNHHMLAIAQEADAMMIVYQARYHCHPSRAAWLPWRRAAHDVIANLHQLLAAGDYKWIRP